MTTIKEYEAMMEGATDAKAVGGLLLHNIEKMLSNNPDENGWFKNLSDVELRISRDEAKYILELIRVIDLAESVLSEYVATSTDDDDFFILDKAQNVLSEIRKRRGE